MLQNCGWLWLTGHDIPGFHLQGLPTGLGRSQGKVLIFRTVLIRFLSIYFDLFLPHSFFSSPLSFLLQASIFRDLRRRHDKTSFSLSFFSSSFFFSLQASIDLQTVFQWVWADLKVMFCRVHIFITVLLRFFSISFDLILPHSFFFLPLSLFFTSGFDFQSLPTDLGRSQGYARSAGCK